MRTHLANILVLITGGLLAVAATDTTVFADSVFSTNGLDWRPIPLPPPSIPSAAGGAMITPITASVPGSTRHQMRRCYEFHFQAVHAQGRGRFGLRDDDVTAPLGLPAPYTHLVSV